MRRIRIPYIVPGAYSIIVCLAVMIAWGPAYAEKLNIVTATTDLAAITRAVAGDYGDVQSIATGKEDPHFLQARPSYMVAARKANLWIRVGMDLEVGWEPPVLDGAYNASIREGAPGHLDASEKILKLEIPEGRISRAMGDVHPLGNPHYWLDPLNGRIVAKSIAERLCALAPENAQYFQNNLKDFQKALDERMFGEVLVDKVGGAQLWTLLLRNELDSYLSDNDPNGRLDGWLARMRPFRGEKIVTYHKSWIYFANRFGLVIADELEPKPGIPPSPSHLAKVIDHMKTGHIRVILLEPFYGKKTASFVASKTESKVVVCPISVGGAPEADSYLSLIELIVTRVAEAFPPASR